MVVQDSCYYNIRINHNMQRVLLLHPHVLQLLFTLSSSRCFKLFTVRLSCVHAAPVSTLDIVIIIIVIIGPNCNYHNHNNNNVFQSL